MKGVFVVGMHGGGTSRWPAPWFGLGLKGPSDDLGPTTIHPKGIVESVAVMALNDRLLAHFRRSWGVGTDSVGRLPLDWPEDPWIIDRRGEGADVFRRAFPVGPWTLKDPRLCVLLPFWRAVVDDHAAAVLVIRHPTEVARSLAKRSGLPLPEALAMWEYHLRSAMENLSGMAVMATTYEGALADPRGFCGAVSWLSRIGITPGANDIESCVQHLDRRLRHQAASAEDTDLLSPGQRALYEALLQGCGPHDRLVVVAARLKPAVWPYQRAKAGSTPTRCTRRYRRDPGRCDIHVRSAA